MHIRVTFYGRLKQDAGTRQMTLELPGDRATVREAVEAALQRYPALADQRDTLAYSVGAALANPDTPVHDGDEIGFLPPVSGG